MTSPGASGDYVSRGGDKLTAALDHFKLDVRGLTCCDLGSHTGGFVDCLLRRGAAKVYSVDTAYGILAWKLRRDARVVVRERTNAMHAALPEAADAVTIDVGWTRQSRVLPNVARMIHHASHVITLIKPHYEAPRELLDGGVLLDEQVSPVVEGVLERIAAMGWEVCDKVQSPIRGHGGNSEVFALLARPGVAERQAGAEQPQATGKSCDGAEP